MTVLPLREQSGVSLAAVSSWPSSGTMVVPVDDGGNISDAADNVGALTVTGVVAALIVAAAAEGTVADDAGALAAADVFALTVVKDDDALKMPMADDVVLTLTVADAALTAADDAVA